MIGFEVNEKKKLSVVELFAGVGGFRLGLEGWNGKSASSSYQDDFDSHYEIVWSNQFEPSTKTQHASMVYEHRWGKEEHINQDIESINVESIPDHDLLVGGFPCQDYSVAATLKNAKGLTGKKGNLWWSIHRILRDKKQKPKYLLLENVDRLLLSPNGQRGRDFAIILQSLNKLDYIVEWRIINAAEYGMPQKRKRTFIVAYHKNSTIYANIKNANPQNWLINNGTIASAFPVSSENLMLSNQFQLSDDIVEVASDFNKEDKKDIFFYTGIMIEGQVTTLKTTPLYQGNHTILRDVIQTEEVSDEFFISKEDLEKWISLKAPQNKIRVNTDGVEYVYRTGAMPFPDSLDKPARTIITDEGSSSLSRTKHIIETEKGLRRLTPIELERLNMFPDNHTKLEGVSDIKRAFLMGNALVVGIIEKIGKQLYLKHQEDILEPSNHTPNILDLYLESTSVSYSFESPLRYPGGKSRAVKLITQFFPKNLKTLISPFFGGGSIELYCAAMGVKVYGYDSFKPLTNFWNTLLSYPEELANEVEKHYPLSKEAFYELQEKLKSISNGLESAAIFYVLNRASFSGVTLSGGMSPNHPRFTPASIDNLRVFQNPNIEVEHGNFKDTILKHPNEFLYLDPPYLVENNLYGENGNLHRDFDHKALFELLKNRDNWVLSYNDCEEIQEMYQGFRQVNPYWKYGMSKDKNPNEILIFSHDISINDIDFDKPPVFQTTVSNLNDTTFSDSEKLQLECLEGIIEKGLKTFVEVGEALLEIKNAKLYRIGFANFDEYCQKRWGIGIRQSQRLIRASKVVQNLQQDDQLVALPTSEFQVRSLADLEPEQQRQVWQEITQSGENVTGKLVEDAVRSITQNDTLGSNPISNNPISDADIKTIQNTSLQVHFSSESYEWYTPKNIIEATITVLGVIDLDPCSNSSINPNVPAKSHFTKSENGLSRAWNGNVYMNPPYGKEIKEWTQKLIHHYSEGDISQAVALLPARTDTEWFHLMREYPRCFLKGRLNFSDSENAAPFPSVVFYLGNNTEQFKTAFGELGDIFRLA